MEAPNRSQAVAEIWNKFPPVGLVKNDDDDMVFPHDDARRAYLMLVMLPQLNLSEGPNNGKWGYLIKTEQGNKIPADIAVWKDTLDHFDILTDKGPTWGEHGKIQPSWKFGEVSSLPVDPPVDNGEEPPIIDEPKPPFTELLLLRIITVLDEILAENKTQSEALRTGLSDLKDQIAKGIKIKF